MANTLLTATAITAAIKISADTGRDVWLSDDASTRGAGRLQMRARPTGGHRWYWRYAKSGGATARILLGAYTAKRKTGALTLAQARDEAAEKATLYRAAESRDVRAHLQREADAVEAATFAANQAMDAALASEAAAKMYTLSGLIDAYSAYLEKQGKQSAGDAANIFANHVKKTHPAIAELPANTITARNVVTLLRELTEANKGRTAAKLRSYLGAAFALAARSSLDSTAPKAFLPFNVESNPVRATAALSQYNRVLDRALEEPELREYWAALKGMAESAAKDALMLALLLGGQRPAQMVRVTTADVDLHAAALRLFDGKGKRFQPRVHVLPLPPLARRILAQCVARADRQQTSWLFSTHGKAPLQPATLTHAVGDIAAHLFSKPKAERIIRAPFQLRDVRRTCETRLVALGVSKEVRAQIQSHGLGGVQARHYDRYDYAAEKSDALIEWEQFLECSPVSSVSGVRERRGRRGVRRGR